MSSSEINALPSSIGRAGLTGELSLTDALKLFYAGLLKTGITQPELDLMTRRNPATLLELN